MAFHGRSKNKIQDVLTLKHIYQYYCVNTIKESDKVDYRLFRDICQDFNKMIFSLILNEGYFFKMPYRLGTIRIKKRKVNVTSKNLKVDFGLLNESGGKYVNKHLNEHSGGYYLKFHWNKVDMVIINKQFYSFIPTRINKRELARIVKENGILQVNKYFE